MKTILNKIYIHPLTFLVIILSLFTGLFKELFTFLFIIIIHEIGHISAALYFKWNISKITIMPFGGIIIFDELINRPIYEETIILIMGPLFQLINFIIFKDISLSFNNYNYGLFLFNSIPIYPLDGYKLWNILFSLFIPFKLTMKVTLIISLFSIFYFLKFNLIYLLVFLFLFIGVIKQYINIDYIYNKFLFERYNYNLKFKHLRKIKNINNMYKGCRHLIENKRVCTEKEILYKLFNK